MPLSYSRLSAAFGLVLLVASASSANAQVTVRLTTAQQTNCTATTDANGLSLVPGSSDLQASGVTLTGNGCGTAGADFQANLNVPSSTQVGTPTNVTWSAGQQATRCVYGGSAGLTGWPIGTVACQGAQCAQQNTTQVTPGAAGNYDLSITCTNDSGFRQGALTATSRPDGPQPPQFALTVTPSAPTVNTPFQVSWTVNGATSCTGTAQFNGAPLATLGGWTDTTATTSPRNVTATQAGTYTLSLVCSNANGSASSQPPATVVVSDTSTSCNVPGMTRLTNTRILYPNLGPVPPPARSNVDVTLFENIWGHGNTTDTATVWPGRNGAVPAIANWGKTQFIAAKFTATTSSSPVETLRYSTYYSGPALTLSVSQTCGDFAPANPLCLTENVGSGGDFKKIVVQPHTNGCPLTPGTDYYINIKMTNPQPTDCTSCTLATTNIVSSQ